MTSLLSYYSFRLNVLRLHNLRVCMRVGVCLWVRWVVVWVGWELLLIMYSNFFTLHFFYE